jgi:hypothetical protein
MDLRNAYNQLEKSLSTERKEDLLTVINDTQKRIPTGTPVYKIAPAIVAGILRSDLLEEGISQKQSLRNNLFPVIELNMSEAQKLTANKIIDNINALPLNAEFKNLMNSKPSMLSKLDTVLPELFKMIPVSELSENTKNFQTVIPNCKNN